LSSESLEAHVILNSELKVVEANRAACELFDYSHDEFHGLSLRDLIPREDITNVAPLFQSGHAARVSKREWRMLRSDGGPLFAAVSAVPVDDGCWQIAVEDITIQKQIEISLHENERRLQAIVDSIDEIVFEFDADGTYINIWTKNEHLLARPREELLGRRAEEVLDPLQADTLIKTIRRVLFSGQPESLEYPLPIDNELRWFLARIAPISSVNSFVKTVCMVSRDITERKRAEEELEYKSAEIAALYRASSQLLTPAGDVVGLARQIARSVTREFDFVACTVLLINEARNELHRVASEGEFSPQAWPTIPVPGPGLTVAAYLTAQPVYAPDVNQDRRYLLGDPSTCSELAVPLQVAQRVIGVLDVQSPEFDAFPPRARDIVTVYAEHAALALDNAQLVANLEHARRVAEEANQLKSMFLANTSHELRTPLSAIMGALEIVLENMVTSPGEQRRFIQTAHTSAQRLLYLINDLLDFAKIEADKVDLQLEPVDILTLVGEVHMLVQAQAEKKGLLLTLQVVEEPPPIRADATKVRQVLLNLLGNAVKFTEHGEVATRVQVDRAHRRAQIVVHDTGIGIPLEKQAMLFQPFVQGDGTMTRRYGGTGLGLSISKRLAELMGGALTFYSAGAGQGSEFVLHLPIAELTGLVEVK
jgi:PAS domain S-box-containing protein